MEQFVNSEATRMDLAVGGMITAAVRCIAVDCKGGAIWRGDLDDWWGWNGHAGCEARIEQGKENTDDD